MQKLCEKCQKNVLICCLVCWRLSNRCTSAFLLLLHEVSHSSSLVVTSPVCAEDHLFPLYLALASLFALSWLSCCWDTGTPRLGCRILISTHMCMLYLGSSDGPANCVEIAQRPFGCSMERETHDIAPATADVRDGVVQRFAPAKPNGGSPECLENGVSYKSIDTVHSRSPP